MRIKTALIAAVPVVLVVLAIAYFNPEILTWPVVCLLAVVFGVVGAISARIIDGR